ncbi:MAG TPA: hypothetical protein VHP33_30535 [Polyangiaceae bacterium]|nr:hypothetical protein [Polyangiaceae bacterium]
MARALVVVASMASVLLTSSAHAADELPFDGRDRYTLFDRHLQTRQLSLQLEAPDQRFRVGRRWDALRAAGDVQIGTQQTYGHGEQTHFHGFAIADTFASMRLLPELSVGVNLLIFNPSASDGYRVSSSVKPGVALDAGANLFRIAGRPLRLGVTGTDLGTITLGNGLLFEQGQLEGMLAWLDYGDASLSYMYGGRSLWDDDDLIRTQLSLWAGRLRFMFVEWQSQYQLLKPGSPLLLDSRRVARYADVALDLPLPAGFRSAVEYAVRFRDPWRSAALLRVDWLRRDLGALQMHLGYQFRFYQHGAGPRNFAVPPSEPFSFPYQEDTYVTNPFEYLGLGEDFDQWSHTLMCEARFELARGLQLFANEELWQRTASAFSRSAASAATAEGFTAPGGRLKGYYTAGVSYYPWRTLPHRADVLITNKQVPGEAQETVVRFAPGRYYVLRFRAQF